MKPAIIIHKRRPIVYALIKYALIILMIGLMGCENKKPIKLGFAGCLTGRHSVLGSSGRDGVILAVETLNKAGGINGRPIELIIKDDRHDPEVAIRVDKELINEGVVAIIGHMTSSMSIAVLPFINKEKILIISPTASTNKLTGIDDYFFRVTPPSITQTDHLARHSFKEMGLRNMAVVYDLSNRTFSEGLYHNFKSAFMSMGGTITSAETFLSGKKVAYLDLTKNLLDSEPDGLLIVASALDTAMLCQQIRKLGSKIPIVSSAWAKTSDLIQHGGSAVEGIIFSSTYNKESKHKNFVIFKKQFKERFGRIPDFGAVFSYEAAQLLFYGLSTTDEVEKLKDTIINRQIYPGLQGDIQIDKYGDVKRKRFIITVKDGQLITLE